MMNRTMVLACLLALMSGGFETHADDSTGTGSGSPSDLIPYALRVDDLDRQYWLHRPATALSTDRMPLVVVLHGGGGADAETLLERFDFDEIGDQVGFIVAYPQGVDSQWNDGRGVSFGVGKDVSAVDDIAFIDAMIDDVARQFPIDLDRVYLTGASNGGMMAYRLGIELGDRLAAIVPMIANIPVNIAHLEPVRSLPVLIMNGTEDPHVPWDGGPVVVFGKGYGEVVSTQDSLDYWLVANGLSGVAPVRTWLPNADRHDGCRVLESVYRAADGSLDDVVLYTLQGGGHAVPGSLVSDRPLAIGNQCMDIDGSQVAWEFFSRQRRGG